MADRVVVGVGIDVYDVLPELTWAVDDVAAIARRLREGGFSVVTPVSGRRSAIVDTLDGLGAADGLVLLWAGHGERSARGTLRLFAAENAVSDGDMKLITVDELAETVAAAGARQSLLILDTCHSGSGALDAAGVIAALRGRIESGWVGVLTASRAHQPAIDGLLASKLVDLLDYGPQGDRLRLRWSVYQELLRGDDLVDALLSEWDDDRQRPEWVMHGQPDAFLPNPLYRPGASEAVVEHLLWSARGGSQTEAGFWFTGREEQLRAIVAWAARGEPGLCLVTGEAGCGKSAVVGRIVSLSSPLERAEIAAATGLPAADLDPGVSSVAAHVQARGMTLEQLAESLARQLGTPGKHHQEVLGALASATAPPLIVIDGLDEAGDDAIAPDFLAPLARYARVLVATRAIPEPLAGLTIELDNSPVHDYVLARLENAGVDAHAVADAIDGPFLLARIITSQLIAEPGSADDLPKTIDEAFIRDVGTDQLAVLSALAYSYGQGFPDDVWAAVADATRADVLAVLGQYGRYVTVSSLAGQAVYRLHQRIAETRRGDPAQAAPAVLDTYARHIARGLPADAHPYLWRHAWQHAADGGPDAIEALAALDPALRTDAGIAWNSLGSGLALSGHHVDAVAPLERAAAIFAQTGDETFLATALGDLGNAYAAAGRWAEAIEPSERAVTIRERLAADDPAFLNDLAGGLTNLGAHYGDVGRHQDAIAATERAVAIREALAVEDPDRRVDLAGSLSNLGMRYAAVGRRNEAVAPTERAVAILEEVAAANPAMRNLLAGALINLAIRYDAVGRDADAVEPSERAVAIREALAGTTPAARDELARALVNVSSRYAADGRHHAAIAPNERAVAIYRELAAANPGFRAEFAGTLNNLANRYSAVGRRADAVAPAEAACEHYGELAAENPAFGAGFAKTLVNLGALYGELGRSTDAIAPSEAGAAALAELAAANPGFRSEFARALENLGNRYADVGRRADALAASTRAVEVYSLASSPAGLAAALTSLGARFGDVGRHDDAVAATERAVAIRERLVAEHPGQLPDLAAALKNLGGHQAGAGRFAAGIAPTERAIAIYERLAGENPAYLDPLAGALNNAAALYEATGRKSDALAAIRRAAESYEPLVLDHPAVRGPFAGVLHNLGLQLEGEAAAAALVRSAALYAELTAENPGFARELANVLNHLGDDAAWTDVLRRFAGDRFVGATLRVGRERSEFAARLADLVAAAGLDPGDEPFLTAEIHAALRRLRGDERFAWPGERPVWLDLDDALFDAAFAWLNADSITESRDRLDPRLLSDAGEAVLAEIALRYPGDERLATHRDLLANVRAHGVGTTYAPLLAEDAYRTWEAIEDPAQRRRFLEANAELVLSVEDPIMAARVLIAATGSEDLTLDEARRGADPAVLNAVAALHFAHEPTRAVVHMAMAVALSGEDASGVLEQLPDDADRSALMLDVSDAIAHRPERARELAAVLTALRRP